MYPQPLLKILSILFHHWKYYEPHLFLSTHTLMGCAWPWPWPWPICDHLMFHVPCSRWQSDQVTGHWTDCLLSLYTRSVTIGTMVIFDTIQVVNRGGRSSPFFCQLLPYIHSWHSGGHSWHFGVKILMLMTLTLLKRWGSWRSNRGCSWDWIRHSSRRQYRDPFYRRS